MKWSSKPARALVLLVSALAISIIATPVLAATCSLEAKIAGSAQVTLPDFTNGTAGWAPTTRSVNGTPSSPGRNQGGVYLWTQLSGPAATLENVNDPQLTFIAPDVGPGGAEVIVRLTVTGCGSSASADVKFQVTDAYSVVSNHPPHAYAAGNPTSANEGTTVLLDSAGSYDTDAGTILSYHWTQTGGPEVSLIDATGPVASFVAPNVTSTQTLQFNLTVSDGSLNDSATALVNVVWINEPPIADISCPLEVDELQSVTLNGSASSDSDDGIASYLWEQTGGLPDVPAVLTGTPWDTGSVTFAAPQLGYQQTGHVPFRFTVTDASGASSSKSCSIFIRDITRPDISVPGDFTEEATSAAGATVTYTASAFDLVDGALPALNATPYFICEPPPGDTFALDAATPVLCSAEDSAGNTSEAGFKISVVDTTAPVISVPLSVAFEATGPDGAVASYEATSADAVDGGRLAGCSPAAGTMFAIATTRVTCNATDTHGNAAQEATFDVVVHDTTAPIISAHGDETAEASGPDGAVVTYAAPAVSDAVSISLVAGCLPASGSTFSLGSHAVTCNVSDAAGNPAAPTSFQVTVQDTTAPVISYLGDISAVSGSNSASVVDYPQPTAIDLVDGAVTVSCLPASGSTFGMGTTLVECATRDSRNNVATGSFNVHVSYAFTGFFRPVDNAPTYNTVKAGSAVPVKFSLGGNQGMSILAAGFPKSGAIQCDATEGDAVEETVLAGSSSLQYDPGTDQYIYVWKTEKNWVGNCRILQLKLSDGSTKSALFKFK